jgi:hypothetical protein
VLNILFDMAHQSQGGPTAYVTSFSPQPDIKDPVDTNPSDLQPPGVDENEPQSLEEALLGE